MIERAFYGLNLESSGQSARVDEPTGSYDYEHFFELFKTNLKRYLVLKDLISAGLVIKQEVTPETSLVTETTAQPAEPSTGADLARLLARIPQASHTTLVLKTDKTTRESKE